MNCPHGHIEGTQEHISCMYCQLDNQKSQGQSIDPSPYYCSKHNCDFSQSLQGISMCPYCERGEPPFNWWKK